MKQDVLVVGAGPVGLTMAAELARYGVHVRIIDKAPGRSDKSKALVLWSRTLELIDRMGCDPSFVSAGFKVRTANIVAGGRQIAHISLAALGTPHPYALMLPQSETERLMEQQLNTCGVQVERRVELLRFIPNPEQVTATLRHADGQEETVDAAWLVGCDGAHSAVRPGLGIAFEGDTLPSHWVLADVHLTRGPVPPDELVTYWHTDGVLVLFPISPGRYRVIADVGDTEPGENTGYPTLQDVQALLDHRGPGGMTLSDPIWLARFTINERKVTDYRAGRVFLAGDAAHIHSPAGGQGMNTGMQDACNLAWKLALVCRRLADSEPLLGSYSTERSEVGRQVLVNASRLTSVAIVRNHLLQGLRNHVASLVFGLSFVQKAMTYTMAELSIGYPHSPLTRAHGPRHAKPAAGERAPADTNVPLAGSGDTPRFVLFAATEPAGAELVARHARLLEPKIRPPFAEDGIWLVRPDLYVAMIAARGDWDEIGAYMDQIAGACLQSGSAG